jgi:hypothetical protein
VCYQKRRDSARTRNNSNNLTQFPVVSRDFETPAAFLVPQRFGDTTVRYKISRYFLSVSLIYSSH